jgi:hypothetical protein
MAPNDSNSNGWSTYERLVLDKLNRHEKLLKDMTKDVGNTCKEVAVMKAKIYAVVVTITVVISAGWQVVSQYTK